MAKKGKLDAEALFGEVFSRLGGLEAMHAYYKKNPGPFYERIMVQMAKIASKPGKGRISGSRKHSAPSAAEDDVARSLGRLSGGSEGPES